MKRLLTFLLVLALLLTTVYSCKTSSDLDSKPKEKPSKVKKPKKKPSKIKKPKKPRKRKKPKKSEAGLNFSNIEASLINRDNQKQKVRLRDKKYLVLYFTSVWCGSCSTFTPKLAEFYNSFPKKERNFEVIHVSFSSSEQEMLKDISKKNIPWLAIKYEHREKVNPNMVKGLPYMALVDTGTNEFVDRNIAWKLLDKLKKMPQISK